MSFFIRSRCGNCFLIRFQTDIHSVRKLVVGHAEDVGQAVGEIIVIYFQHPVGYRCFEGGEQNASRLHIVSECVRKPVGNAVERGCNQQFVLTE